MTILLLAAISRLAWAQRSRADETLIKKQLADYAEARSGGNGHAQASFYTEDADEWGAKRQMPKGRAELERDLAGTPIPGKRFKLEVSTLSFLTADIVLVDALYSVPRTGTGGRRTVPT